MTNLPTPQKMKVIHLNNVADTGKNLVRSGRELGYDWSLRLIPPANGASYKVAAARLKDLGKWMAQGERPALLHVHYAPNAYYAWARRIPYVLHAHGSDVRKDLNRTGTSALTRRAILNAESVIAATPDLLEPLQEIRPDAVFLPNPTSLELVKHTFVPPAMSGKVVFNARWEADKGGVKLINAAKKLLENGVDVWGLDWGIDAPTARALGVKLVPRLHKRAFHAYLESADVVVGQSSYGCLGVSDLETLTLGRPLVALDNLDKSPAIQPEGDIAERVLELLADSSRITALAQKSREWALENRDPHSAAARLNELYEQILKS